MSSVKRAKPFLKWVGGKGQLLKQFDSIFPKDFSGTYYEPFVGGGAVLFHLHPQKAVINDINTTLVETYRNIQTNSSKVIKELKKLQEELDKKTVEERKEFYYSIRNKYNKLENKDFKKSIYFLFFNKTAFNGVYRENSKGGFNVPIGAYKNPKILDENNILIVARSLRDITILNSSYKTAVKKAKKGDFVYFDPPYHPLSKTSSFTTYSKDNFSEKDQTELRDLFVELDKKGVLVMLSNSNTDFIKKLYKGYKQIPVSATRMVNSNSAKRGSIQEIVVINYQLHPPGA